MSETVESIGAVGGAAVLLLLSKRRWARISALAIAGVLLAIAMLGLLAHMSYFSLRCASFATPFAVVVGQRRPWAAATVAAGALGLALASAAWLLASDGTITIVVGESVDPSQRAQIFDTIDAVAGFLSTIVVCLLVATFAGWSQARPKPP